MWACIFLVIYKPRDGFFYLTLTLMIDSYPLKRKKHASGLPNITDELSLEANNVNPEQTDPLGAV